MMQKGQYVPKEWRLAIRFWSVDAPPVVEEDLQDLRRLGQHGAFYKIPVNFHPLRKEVGKGGRLIIGSSAMGSKIEMIFADISCDGFWSLLRKPDRVNGMYFVQVADQAGFFDIMEVIGFILGIYGW